MGGNQLLVAPFFLWFCGCRWKCSGQMGGNVWREGRRIQNYSWFGRDRMGRPIFFRVLDVGIKNRPDAGDETMKNRCYCFYLMRELFQFFSPSVPFR